MSGLVKLKFMEKPTAGNEREVREPVGVHATQPRMGEPSVRGLFGDSPWKCGS